MTTTAPACQSCTKPMPTGDNAPVCPGCWDTVERQLGDITALVDDLETTLARQARTELDNTGLRPADPEPDDDHDGLGVHEQALTYDAKAADALRDLHTGLWHWVKLVLDDDPAWQPIPREGPLEEAGHPLPAWQRRLPGPGIVPLSAVLLGSSEWLRRHEDALDFTTELEDLTRDARRAVDLAPDRWYAGTCGHVDDDHPDVPPCAEKLYPIAGKTHHRCTVCGTTHDVVKRRDQMLDRASELLLNLTELQRAVALTGRETVTRKQLEGWVRRGKLVRAGNDGPTALYRVGDVQALIRTTETTGATT